MPHHYTKNVVSDTKYCNTCGKPTPHYVLDGRLGRCMNDHPHPEPKPKVEDKQENLFK